MWVHYKNGNIQLGPTTLKKEWFDSSGNEHDLTALSETKLNDIGWYRFERNFDNSYKELKNYTIKNIKLQDNTVIAEYVWTWKNDSVIDQYIHNIIDEYRNQKLIENIIYGGVEFDGLKRTKTNLTSTISGIISDKVMNNTYKNEFKWIATDNKVYTFTEEEIIDWGTKWKEYISQCYYVARNHKDAVMSYSDPVSKIEYDITVGWPSNDLGGTISSTS